MAYIHVCIYWLLKYNMSNTKGKDNHAMKIEIKRRTVYHKYNNKKDILMIIYAEKL